MTGNVPADSPRRQRFRPGPDVRAALAAGFLSFAAFPPIGLAPLLFVAWAPLLNRLLVTGGALSWRRVGFLAWLAAVVFYVGLLHWLLLLANDEVTIPGIMLPALLVLAGYLALFPALALVATRAIARASGLSPLLLFPFLWTATDWLRALGETAFPWGSWGYAFAPWTPAIQMTAWTGYWGLVFWVAAANALVVWAVGGLPLRRWLADVSRVRATALLLWGCGPWIFGAALLRGVGPESVVDRVDDRLRITLIQANTPREIKWKPGYRVQVVEDLLERTRRAAAETSPDLIVWPETAAPIRIPWEPELARRLSSTVDSLDAWVLVGTLDAVVDADRTVHDYNAALLLDPAGAVVERYYKSHLVPFGEVTPFKRAVPLLAKLDFGQSEFDRGREGVIFAGPDGLRFACLICFESIFPELARDGVRSGATVLVNITNDFWFGRSSGPVQHAHMAILRAVENRTPVARCANSGLSFFVDAYGRVTHQTGLFEAAMPTAAVRPGSGGSFATRHGESVLRLVWLGVSGAVLFSLARSLSARFRRPSPHGKMRHREGAQKQ